jgi:TonB family protein
MVNDSSRVPLTSRVWVYKAPLRKNLRVFVRLFVRFSLYAALAILSQVAELLAGGAHPLPNSALPWPKSPKYDKPPKLVSGNYPVFPISHSRFGRSGFAVVAFTIGQNGKTYDIEVLKASYPYFGSHTVLAVRDWKFEPALKNGKAVSVRTKLVMPLKGWRG